MKEALEDMVYQFGYHVVVNNTPAISTGGLSALESAFDALGWDDPHLIDEKGNTCEVVGCMESIVSGVKWGDIYLCLCHNHSMMAYDNQERPPIKDYAIIREQMRDKATGFINDNID
jgi:hypothetical protein